jgi:hypothetical protein
MSTEDIFSIKITMLLDCNIYNIAYGDGSHCGLHEEWSGGHWKRTGGGLKVDSYGVLHEDMWGSVTYSLQP